MENKIYTNNYKISLKIFINLIEKYYKDNTFKLIKFDYFKKDNRFFITLLENETFLKENNLSKTYYFIIKNNKQFEKFIKEIHKIII